MFFFSFKLILPRVIKMNNFQNAELNIFKERHKKSLSLWNRSLKKFPGGVNHNIRSFNLPLSDAYPVFISASKDITLTDVDGNLYTDFWLGHYSQILGHNNPAIKLKIQEQLDKGWMFGTVIEDQVLLAEKITSISKSVEEVRFQTSGSESVMNALRLARAYTKRDVIARVDLGWHGTNETISNGSSVRLEEHDDSETSGKQKVVVFQLTQSSIERLFKEFGKQLACVIIEPVIGSGGAFKVEEEILKQIRESCDTYGVVLIFDEIVSGFRFQYGLYQDTIGVYPDLTTLGKIIGGGFPIGGLGGMQDIMELANPTSDKANKVTIGGGTFSSHPMTLVAGNATIDLLESKKEDYKRLNELGGYLKNQLNTIFRENNFPSITTSYGSLIFINTLKTNPWEKEIPDITISNMIDKKAQATMQLALLNRTIHGNHGIGALSFLHTKKDLDFVIENVNDIVLKSKE